MEACLFIASCNRAKVKSLCACAAILNRLNGDQVTSPKGMKNGVTGVKSGVLADMVKYVEDLMNVCISFVSEPLFGSKK